MIASAVEAVISVTNQCLFPAVQVAPNSSMIAVTLGGAYLLESRAGYSTLLWCAVSSTCSKQVCITKGTHHSKSSKPDRLETLGNHTALWKSSTIGICNRCWLPSRSLRTGIRHTSATRRLLDDGGSAGST